MEIRRLWARLVLGYTDPDHRDEFDVDLCDLLVAAGARPEDAVHVVATLDLDSLDDAEDLELDDAEDAAYDLLVGLRSDLVAHIVLRTPGEPPEIVDRARELDRRFDAMLDVVDAVNLDEIEELAGEGEADDLADNPVVTGTVLDIDEAEERRRGALDV
jgi:hypothetical protein